MIVMKVVTIGFVQDPDRHTIAKLETAKRLLGFNAKEDGYNRLAGRPSEGDYMLAVAQSEAQARVLLRTQILRFIELVNGDLDPNDFYFTTSESSVSNGLFWLPGMFVTMTRYNVATGVRL